MSKLENSVRLDAAGTEALLHELDGVATSVERERRRARRYSCRVKSTVVHMGPGHSGVLSPFRVPTRNIADGGLAFLHAGFLYPNTRLAIEIITRYGAWTNVGARVVHCRYVGEGTHEVGVCFEQPIEPSLYCAAADQLRVLLVEDDPGITRLTTLFLKQLNAEVQCVEDGRAAIEAAVEIRYDLILMDMELPVLDGFEATAELRRRGYSGLIVAATSLNRPEDRERCFDAGCDRFLPKPYSQEDLSQLLETLQGEPLFSSLSDDPAVADLIGAFVLELSAKRRAIARALAQEDAATLEPLLRSLRAEAGSYGFEPIAEAAAKIEAALADGSSLCDVSEKLAALFNLCLKARAPARVSAPHHGA